NHPSPRRSAKNMVTKDGGACGAKRKRKWVRKRFVLTPRAAAAAATRHLNRVLEAALPALRPEARAQLCDVTMRAAPWRASLSATQDDLGDGLSARQLRRLLENLDLAEVEAAVNRELWMQSRDRLPSECIVAVDLTLIPYHGEAFEDERELRRCKPKDGTT